MITKEQYKESRDLIRNYEKQLVEELVLPYTCICCKTKKITPIEPQDVLKQEKGMWDGGTVTKLTFGWSSIHDLDSFYIAICDDCCSDLRDKKLITNYKELQDKVYESISTRKNEF